MNKEERKDKIFIFKFWKIVHLKQKHIFFYLLNFYKIIINLMVDFVDNALSITKGNVLVI